MICYAGLELAACRDATPSGQVIAVANGEEITLGELRAEAATIDRHTADQSRARSELLRHVVDRKLWAQEAQRGKLDRQIKFLLARRRAEESLLADLQIRTLGDNVEPPSDNDVSRFLRENPDAFASRTVFKVEQINFQPGGELLILRRLKKAKSLDEVDELLTNFGILSQRSRADWNSMFMPVSLAARLERLSPSTLFLHRDGGTVIAAVVIGRTSVTLSNDRRIIIARQSLTRRRINAAISQKLEVLRASAEIKLQPGFVLANSAR